MNLPATFQAGDFAYALVTVFFTVFFILLLRQFGNLPISLFGVDLNLLTYGYLWDTAQRALRGSDYWSRWKAGATVFHLNKPTILVLISVLNLILLAWNMKILNQMEINIKKNEKVRLTNWFLRPLAIAVGIMGLLVFVFCNAIWG